MPEQLMNCLAHLQLLPNWTRVSQVVLRICQHAILPEALQVSLAHQPLSVLEVSIVFHCGDVSRPTYLSLHQFRIFDLDLEILAQQLRSTQTSCRLTCASASRSRASRSFVRFWSSVASSCNPSATFFTLSICCSSLAAFSLNSFVSLVFS